MPSRKLTDRCGQCGYKNHLRARFCNQCGHKLDEDRATRDADGRAKLHADIAHPINSACREVIQSAVLRNYQEERERAKQPGYTCTYDDFDGGDYSEESLSQVIGELNAPRRNGENFRSHGPHGPRGRHAPSQESTIGTRDDQRSEGFGAGIL